MYYFAYGSNMDRAQMRSRCPTARARGRAYLVGHRLAFCGHSALWGGAVATVVPTLESTVPGLLYELDPAELEALDHFEGHPSVYQRVALDIETERFGEVSAWVYVRPFEQAAAPSERYFGAIASAYRRLGYPALRNS